MRYFVFIAIIALVSCTKQSENIVGTWSVDRAEWTNGSNTITNKTTYTFTDNGRIIINGVDKYGYMVKDDHHMIVGGKEYQYDLHRKSLKLYYWYMQYDPVSFPDIVLYLSK